MQYSKSLDTSAKLFLVPIRLHVNNWECRAQNSPVRCQKFGVPCRYFFVRVNGVIMSKGGDTILPGVSNWTFGNQTESNFIELAKTFCQSNTIERSIIEQSAIEISGTKIERSITYCNSCLFVWIQTLTKTKFWKTPKVSSNSCIFCTTQYITCVFSIGSHSIL